MIRIRIEDLPVSAELAAEQMDSIYGGLIFELIMNPLINTGSHFVSGHGTNFINSLIRW